MRFTTISDTDSEVIKIGPAQDAGSLVWFPVLYLHYWEAWGDQPSHTYGLTIGAVSPDALTKQGNIDKIKDMYGMEDGFNWTQEELIRTALDYGAFVPLWTQDGNNRSALERAARAELPLIEMLSGFYLDKRYNGLGATGWDLLMGEIMPGKRGAWFNGEDES